MILRTLADLVLAAHFAMILFVVTGQILILAGWIGRWAWIRNFTFRVTHLCLVVFVMIEDWMGVACPLTIAERWLRKLAQVPTHDKSFVAYWLGKLQYAFVDAPQSTFVMISTIFGLLVIVSFLACPPRFSRISNLRSA